MLKVKKYFLGILLGMGLLGTASFAAPVCKQSPTYNILSSPNFVEIFEGRLRLILHTTGNLSINGKLLELSAKDQEQVRALVVYIQKNLAGREKEAENLMNSLHAQFVNTVRAELQGNHHLIKMLDNVKNDAHSILAKAINTERGLTSFTAVDFNKIIDRASSNFKMEAAKIFSKSLVTFNLGKNYKDIKYLGDREWKKRKVEAKAFRQQLCDDLDFITKEKDAILKQHTTVRQ